MKRPRIAVIQFPGSNADWDALHAFRDVLGCDARYVFHKETSLDDFQAIVIPGGFSFGDYLRPGSIAGFSPIVPAIVREARRGVPTIGICNGFQVLTEIGLLPGALTRNAHLRFECRDVHVRVTGTGIWTQGLDGETLRLPVAHADGRYQCDAESLALLQDANLIALRYCEPAPPSSDDLPYNPNGSIDDIAGIYNLDKNVLGLMPHPERAAESILGNSEGRRILEAIL